MLVEGLHALLGAASHRLTQFDQTPSQDQITDQRCGQQQLQCGHAPAGGPAHQALADHAPQVQRQIHQPLAALGLPLTVYLPPFYSQMPGLNTGLVGVLIFAARLFDVITDPVIGSASDRLQTRFGRRRPWIAAGTPLLMLAAWFLFVPPANAGAAYLLIWSMLAYLGWTLIYLPYTTLGAEMSADYDERSRITAWREGFFVLGTLVAIMLPALAQRFVGGAAAGLAAIAMFLTALRPNRTIARLIDPI